MGVGCRKKETRNEWTKALRGKSGSSGCVLASLSNFSRLWRVGANPAYPVPRLIRAGG